MSALAQGWYRDPYEIHEDRYFTEGWPTKLVRDQGHESYDLPPDLPLPEGDLVPVPDGDDGAADGTDLRRADEIGAARRRDAETAARSVFDIFDQTAGQW